MINEELDFQLYPGKSFNDLLKDIVTNADNKRDQIDISIAELRDQIKTINDAIVLAPIIKEYIDLSIKNDDALVKLASVCQKLISLQSETSNIGFGITDSEKDALMKEIKEIELNIDSPVKIKNKNS